MAAPISGQSSPITYNNQRLIVQDEKGMTRRYRLIIRKKGETISLTAEQEQKAALAIQKILTEAGLNQAGVDLSKASLKGRVLKYEGKKVEKQPKATTYKEFKNVIDSVKIPAKKADPPAQDAIKTASPKPAVKPSETTKATKLSVNGEKKEGFIATLFTRIQAITSIFRRSIPAGAKNLEQISAALEKAISTDGKLRLENNSLMVTAREIGISSRKGGKSSVEALTFLLTEVQKTLNKEAPTENEKILVSDILNKLATYSWSQASFKKNPEVLELFDNVKANLQKKNIVDQHFFGPKELYDALINAKDPVIVANFFLGYRDVFDGAKSTKELKEIKDGVERFKEMQAMKSIEMLGFLYDQTEASIEAGEDSTIAYKNLFKLVSEWLNDDSYNGKDYLHADVANQIEAIIQNAKVPDNEKKDLQSLLKSKLEQVENLEPPTIKENAPDFHSQLEKLKRDELTPKEYENFVRQFAEDLGTLGSISLRGVGLAEIDLSNTATGPGWADNLNYLNNLSNFIIKEILTTVEGVKPKKSAKRMLVFLNDVQKELIDKKRFDSAIQIQAATEKHVITRLKFGQVIPKDEKALPLNMTTTNGKEQLATLYARAADKDTFIPHLGLIRGKLNAVSNSMPSTRKNPDSKTEYNLYKIYRNAENKKNVMQTQKRVQTDGKMNLRGLNELMLLKPSKKQQDALEQTFYQMSEAIVPREVQSQA